MNTRETEPLKRFEDYIPKDHIGNVARFLENPEIDVVGVHISPRIPTYRIVGLKIADEPIGIIVKQSDIPRVKEQLNNVSSIDSKTKRIIRNHLSMIKDVFKQAERELRTKKS